MNISPMNAIEVAESIHEVTIQHPQIGESKKKTPNR